PTTVPPPADPVGLRVEAEYTSGYNRDLFRHWIDADGDGCETRKEVLIAESLEPVQTGSQCAILTGRWYSIYDNTETTDSSRFDIDHVVALKEAWDSGAWNWTADQRKEFANDLSEPFFLIAVSASSNRSKSDRDPAEWLPTNTAYRCDYVRIWIDVKRAWNLSVDPECRCAQAMVLLTKAANSGPRSSCRK
ncbi:MAG: HNH endonuclease family protein, partial [Actinomycetota bacterium]